MENKNNNNPGQLQIDLPVDVSQGQYANFAIITHSSSDFVLDFARILPGVPKATVKSRVIWLLSMQSACLWLFRTIS